jgi:hypothetical protein
LEGHALGGLFPESFGACQRALGQSALGQRALGTEGLRTEGLEGGDELRSFSRFMDFSIGFEFFSHVFSFSPFLLAALPNIQPKARSGVPLKVFIFARPSPFLARPWLLSRAFAFLVLFLVISLGLSLLFFVCLCFFLFFPVSSRFLRVFALFLCFL